MRVAGPRGAFAQLPIMSDVACIRSHPLSPDPKAPEALSKRIQLNMKRSSDAELATADTVAGSYRTEEHVHEILQLRRARVGPASHTVAFAPDAPWTQ